MLWKISYPKTGTWVLHLDRSAQAAHLYRVGISQGRSMVLSFMPQKRLHTCGDSNVISDLPQGLDGTHLAQSLRSLFEDTINISVEWGEYETMWIDPDI